MRETPYMDATEYAFLDRHGRTARENLWWNVRLGLINAWMGVGVSLAITGWPGRDSPYFWAALLAVSAIAGCLGRLLLAGK